MNDIIFILKETNANSIAWNTQFEDIICFSSSKNLSIKVSNFPAHHQYIQVHYIYFLDFVFTKNFLHIRFLGFRNWLFWIQSFMSL